jgi:hypothetical protein
MPQAIGDTLLRQLFSLKFDVLSHFFFPAQRRHKEIAKTSNSGSATCRDDEGDYQDCNRDS